MYKFQNLNLPRKKWLKWSNYLMIYKLKMKQMEELVKRSKFKRKEKYAKQLSLK